jgi:hypothetical protein
MMHSFEGEACGLVSDINLIVNRRAALLRCPLQLFHNRLNRLLRNIAASKTNTSGPVRG